MGNNTANEIANLSEYGIDISLEQQIAWHLQGNHYPPIPTTMVQPCIEAIDAYNEGRIQSLIDLPEGVFYKGDPYAPAWAIVEQHHLESWLAYDEDYVDDEWLDEDDF